MKENEREKETRRWIKCRGDGDGREMGSGKRTIRDRDGRSADVVDVSCLVLFRRRREVGEMVLEEMVGLEMVGIAVVVGIAVGWYRPW